MGTGAASKQAKSFSCRPFNTRELTNQRLLSRRRLLVTSCLGSVSRTIWRQNLITIPGRRLTRIIFHVPSLCLCWKNIIGISLRETTREMPNSRETRKCIAYAYKKESINDREFVLLYDANRLKSPDFPNWNYEIFELDELTYAECNGEFRFYKNDIYKLADALELPDEFVTYNGLIFESILALCIYLKRSSYPCRYSDMVFHFARPVPEICIITNHMIDWIYNRWNHLLTTYNHYPLSPANLSLYADAVHQSGAALDNCWGFIDGTVRSVCRPGVNQRVLYNGHKRVHSIKFQPVALPNGLVGICMAL